MSMLGFERNPEVGKLLVDLYDAHRQYGLIEEDKPEVRDELTRATANLLSHNLTTGESDILAEVVIALMRQAEKDLRRALSEKLSTMPNVPLRLVLHLANDEITIASPILKKSPVLNDQDLLYIIKSQGADYWQAIATREILRDEVINALAATQDVGTAVVLSSNERIVLTNYAMDLLSELGKKHDAVARPLIMREEVPETLVRSMYDYVGHELKDYIKVFYGDDVGAQASHEQVDELILEFVEPKLPPYMPSEAQIEDYKDKAKLGHLSLDIMMEALQKDELSAFIGMFAVYTGLSAKRIHGFLRKSCPKGMVIACRAFGIQKSDFSKIFLMTNKMRSPNRVIDHTDLMRTLTYFDMVRPEVALRIVTREISTPTA